MHSNLSRRLVLATLAAALLIAPVRASAAPEGREVFSPPPGSTFEAIVRWAGDLVRHLWSEEGVSIDPLGRPEPAPAASADGGRQ